MTQETSALLEHRLAAALYDVAAVGLCCAGLLLALNPLVATPFRWVWMPSAALLVIYVAIETLTDVTPGKWLAGIAVRRRDGAPASRAALAVRSLVRLLPVVLLVLGLLARDGLVFLGVAGLSLITLLCYVPACYLMMLRTGRSLFDTAAGTSVVRTNRAPG